MTAAANPPSPFTTPPLLAPSQSTSLWRLTALAMGVLAVHAVVLQAAATRFDLGALRKQPDRAVVLPPLQTRRIETPPPAPTPPEPVIRPAPARPVMPVVRPRPVSKAPTVQSVQAPPVNQIAQEVPTLDAEALVASAPEAPPAPEALLAAPQTAASQTVAAAPLQAAPPPGPVSLAPSAVLSYKMTGSAKGLSYHANAELVWRHDGSRYDAQMTVSVLFLGARSMSSVGEVGIDGLAPTRFTDKSRSEYAAHFEPDKGLITFSANTPPAPWVRGAQDRVSVFFQLGGLLAADPAAYPAGTAVAVYTTGPRSADTWTFKVESEETLALPLGEVRTIKLARQPQRDYDQRVEVWLAPSMGYLPVRNKITQSNGDFIDQQLSDLARP